MRFPNRWTIGDWTFFEIQDHGFTTHDGKALYAYTKADTYQEDGNPKLGEFHASLDRAIIAAIGEKYTGPRGAGGTGVGTAADWFARMIGMDALVPVGQRAGHEALSTLLVETAEHNGPVWRRTQAIEDGLEARGLVLAAMNRG